MSNVFSANGTNWGHFPDRIGIVTAHTFCASRDTLVSYGWCLLIQEYFSRFKTMRRKHNLPSTFGIQKENWGNHAFFRDNKASIWKKRHTLHCFLE